MVSKTNFDTKIAMTLLKGNRRMFGMALDPADDPRSLELKRAWMLRAGKAAGDRGETCLDPYDAITSRLREILDGRNIQPSGKFPVPSWLWPKPEPADFPLVTPQNIGDFYDSGGLLATLKRLQSFVEKEIFPARPVMVGIDHSATAGVISALAARYGSENLSVIVLDQHFDALPLSVRIAGAGETVMSRLDGMPLALSNITSRYQDHCCCGNFWAYLMDEGRILPENISFIGVADYPGRPVRPAGDRLFQKSYLSFEDRGCRFFPLERFDVPYLDALKKFVGERIRTPYAYVSLDLDVGSYNCTWAARYMDRPGISAQNLLDIAAEIRQACQQNNTELAGFDIMEFNMHFLGIETDDGIKDATLSTVGEFINMLTVETIL